MSKEAKEIIRQLVKEQQFTSTGEIMVAMKEMFKEVLEESLEAELDTQLGYEKSERSDSKNRRNGHSTKTVRSELGEIEVSVPRDRNSNRKIAARRLQGAFLRSKNCEVSMSQRYCLKIAEAWKD